MNAAAAADVESIGIVRLRSSAELTEMDREDYLRAIEQGQTKPLSESGFPKLDYRPGLDGLRALAVSAVVLYHFDLLFDGGFAGVEVFFVISGYLISRIIFHEIATSQFSLVGFWSRRVRRLQPAFLVMMVTSITAAYLILYPPSFRSNAGEANYALLSIANFKFYAQVSYFNLPESHMFLHCWSLAVEEQFYLVYASACFILWQIATRVPLCRGSSTAVVVMPLGLLLGSSAVSFSLSVWAAEGDQNFGFYMLPARAWEMLLGAVVVLLPSTSAMYSRRHVQSVLQVLGLLLIVGSFVLLTDSVPYPSYRAGVPCVGTALVILADKLAGSDHQAMVLARVLESPICVWLGKISYSLYLWHWPIFALGTTMLGSLVDGKLDLPQKVAGIALSVILAACSHRWVENTFRRGSSRAFWLALILLWLGAFAILASLTEAVAEPPLMATDLAMTSASGAVAGYGGACVSLVPQNFTRSLWRDVSIKRIMESEVDLDMSYAMQSKPTWNEPTFAKAAHTEEAYPSIVFIGSSHCLMLSHAVSDLAQRFGRHVAFLCASADDIRIHGFEKESSPRTFDQKRLEFLALWKPEVVVWADRWDHYFHMNEEQMQSWRLSELREMFAWSFQTLLKHVKKVVVLGDTPYIQYSIMAGHRLATFARRIYSLSRTFQFLTRLRDDPHFVGEREEVQTAIQLAIQDVSVGNADEHEQRLKFVDIMPFFIDETDPDKHLLVVNLNLSKLLFIDAHHLSKLGAERLAPLLRVHAFGHSPCSEDGVK
mmetsp:Transcript_33032/g.77227  ORF Transcript_33032/g.77227 Transcript_33032/m.77227 type:complete len:770 (-) Transcript_33032:8-2317(-)